MISSLPSLDLKGWITDPVTLGAKLLLHALRSEKGQSTDYNDAIVSLPSLVVLYGKEPEKMVEETKRVLESQFKRYFDYVTITAKAVESETTSRYTVEIDLQYGTETKAYSLGFSVFVSPDTKDIRGTIEKYNG